MYKKYTTPCPNYGMGGGSRKTPWNGPAKKTPKHWNSYKPRIGSRLPGHKFTSQAVWPDLARFHHFSKTLKVFGYSLSVYFVLGQILNLIGQIFMIFDKFWLFLMAQHLVTLVSQKLRQLLWHILSQNYFEGQNEHFLILCTYRSSVGSSSIIDWILKILSTSSLEREREREE